MNPCPCLTAQWRMLVMLSYEVEAALLLPYLPHGTELDPWQGRHFVSLVGFEFTGARLHGLYIPFHQNFEEVNLRFYVRRKTPQGWRRGVVFVKEIGSRLAVALVARWRYNQNFHALPMRREIKPTPPITPPQVAYQWRTRGKWESLSATASDALALPAPGSIEEFIVEHYWAYTRQRDSSTLEYRVAHPRWPVWRAHEGEFTGDAAALYGKAFANALKERPASAFVAEGSEVAVYRGMQL